MKKVSQDEFNTIVNALSIQENKVINELNISGIDLSKTDLTMIILAKSKLADTVFSGDQNFYGYFWHENSVLDCEFKSISFRKSNLQFCIFERCKFTDIEFFRADISKCTFSFCQFSNINRESSKKLHLIGCTFNHCRFDYVDFSLAHFTETKFIDCEFLDAKLNIDTKI